MSASLDCPICMETYEDDDVRYPIVLNCGHSFCFSCTSGYPRNAGQCPFCKVSFNYPNGFPKSYATIDCLNLMKRFNSQQRPPAQKDAVQELLERVNKIESRERANDEYLSKISSMAEDLRTLKQQSQSSSSTLKPGNAADEKNAKKIKSNVVIHSGNDANCATKVDDDDRVGSSKTPTRAKPEQPAIVSLRDLLTGISSISSERQIPGKQGDLFEPFYGTWKFDSRKRNGKEWTMDPQQFISYLFLKSPVGMEVKAVNGLGEQCDWVFSTNRRHCAQLKQQDIEAYHVEFTTPFSFNWGKRKWTVSGKILTREIAPNKWTFIKSAS